MPAVVCKRRGGPFERIHKLCDAGTQRLSVGVVYSKQQSGQAELGRNSSLHAAPPELRNQRVIEDERVRAVDAQPHPDGIGDFIAIARINK